MPTAAQNIALIRQRLLEPTPQHPSDPQLLIILTEHLTNHCVQLQNTRNHWAIERKVITTEASKEDYQIDAPNFGRPFLVYTKDSSDPSHARREVPFTLLQDADRMYQGPQQTQSMDKWSAVEVCFYRSGIGAPQWFIRFVPIPSDIGEYEIWYESNYSLNSLGDTPGLESFHHLVRVQTALSALPYCAWGDLSLEKNPAAWQIRVGMLREGLKDDEAKYQRQFDIFRSQSSREGVTRPLGVGHEYESDWGGGGMISGWGM